MSRYIQTYKSQTFIDLKSGSLPIGITLGLTISNAILARNLGSSLALQAVNTASLSAGSGIAGGISGRVPHHAVTTLRKDLLTELPQSDKRSVRTHVVPTKRCVSSHESEPYFRRIDPGRLVHEQPCDVLPPRPFRNGLKCIWQARIIFFAMSGLFPKESWLRPRRPRPRKFVHQRHAAILGCKHVTRFIYASRYQEWQRR